MLRHFRSVGGRPSPGLTQPKSLSLIKIKHYRASIARSVRSNKWQPHRIGRIATRAWPNSIRLLFTEPTRSLLLAGRILTLRSPSMPLVTFSGPGEDTDSAAVHAHMLRHACGYALANAGHDTRLIQDWLGHRAIQHTARYTELSPTRFKDVWR